MEFLQLLNDSTWFVFICFFAAGLCVGASLGLRLGEGK